MARQQGSTILSTVDLQFMAGGGWGRVRYLRYCHGGVMPSEDASARVKKRVSRLVSQAIAELKSHGIDATGKPPRQIFRMANAARRAAVSPKKKATLRPEHGDGGT